MELNTVVTSVIAAVIVIPLTAYINIKIKFAPDETTVLNHFKAIAFKAVALISNGAIAYLLYREVWTSPALVDVY
jgi:hypothetical protein